VTVVQGVGKFTGPHDLSVETPDGPRRIRFDKAIIAAGSEAVRLPFAPADARIVDSTGALELPFLPAKMLIIGGGIIGLEMGTVYSTLGARLDVVEMLDGLMPGADRDLVRVWMKKNEKRFDKVMLGTKTVAIDAKLRPGPRSRRTPTQWSAHRRGGRGRPGGRAGFHRSRCADAHQRRAYLRDRRPGGTADAGAQGDAPGPHCC
jgi:hypothetical protein